MNWWYILLESGEGMCMPRYMYDLSHEHTCAVIHVELTLCVYICVCGQACHVQEGLRMMVSVHECDSVCGPHQGTHTMTTPGPDSLMVSPTIPSVFLISA